jgi:hypothetical protein
MKNATFYRLIHRRGVTTTTLAKAIRSHRSHVTEVLNNVPGHGGHNTRARLSQLLTAEEKQALGWTCASGYWGTPECGE